MTSMLKLAAALVGEGWRDRARCRNLDPEMFWPSGNALSADNRYAMHVVCGRCPVRRVECREWAETEITHDLMIAAGELWQRGKPVELATCGFCGAGFIRKFPEHKWCQEKCGLAAGKRRDG